MPPDGYWQAARDLRTFLRRNRFFAGLWFTFLTAFCLLLFTGVMHSQLIGIPLGLLVAGFSGSPLCSGSRTGWRSLRATELAHGTLATSSGVGGRQVTQCSSLANRVLVISPWPSHPWHCSGVVRLKKSDSTRREFSPREVSSELNSFEPRAPGFCAARWRDRCLGGRTRARTPLSCQDRPADNPPA